MTPLAGLFHCSAKTFFNLGQDFLVVFCHLVKLLFSLRHLGINMMSLEYTMQKSCFVQSWPILKAQISIWLAIHVQF